MERKDDPIKSIVLKNPVDTAAKEDEKDTIMDIRAETSLGEELDIEMQSGNLKVYPDRVLFYGGRLVNSSLQQGFRYDKMKESIVVSIINGILCTGNLGFGGTGHDRKLIQEGYSRRNRI